MAGQSAGGSLSVTKSNIAAVKSGMGGISGMETSAIGGEGRKGGPGEGPDMPKPHRICDELTARMGGEATTGKTGYNSGYGHTS